MDEAKDQNILSKPKDPENPTRFLYVANCTANGAHGIGEEAIRNFFGQYGDVLAIDSKDDKGYLLLSFSTIESAMDAKEALNGQSHELLGNRRVHIKFADEMTDTIEPTRIECTSETAQIVVPGLSIIEDFITEEEEAKYLEKIDQKEWLTTIQRRVQHYGYEFKYDTRDVDPNLPLGEMPWFCQHTITRLKELRPDIESPDQITLNEYLPGQGIAPHVDTPSAFTSYIGSLSLESDIVMDFRLNGTIVKHVLLKRRALCLMTGDARYLWKHGIAYRKSDMINGELRSRERRVSLTLRKISSVLESTESTTETSSSLAPSSIEVEHVHKVYDNIAPHFSHTRHHPWPLVTDFLMGLPSGSLVADVGCGNGKYLGINPKICMIGSDRSIPLMACSTNRDCYNLFGCDALKVPLRTGIFNAAISIAVLHHISTIERRLELLRELSRLVRVGGSIYIVAWAFEQDERSKRKFDSQDVMVEWKLQEKYASNDQEQTEHAHRNDDKKWIVYQRYCHVYRQGELEALISQIPGLSIISSTFSRSNWCIHVGRY